MVTADTIAEAEERLRNHPDLKNVVSLKIESLQDMGVVDDLEKQVSARIEDMEASLPTDEMETTSNNNNKRKYLN